MAQKKNKFLSSLIIMNIPNQNIDSHKSWYINKNNQQLGPLSEEGGINILYPLLDRADRLTRRACNQKVLGMVGHHNQRPLSRSDKCRFFLISTHYLG